jgi:hypothetical protein
MLIVAMDANFRLQSRLRLSTLKHPALSPGWAYFVDNSPYADFIKDYVDDEEVREQPIITSPCLCAGRSDRVWAFKPSSTCSQRSPEVFVQPAWAHSAVLVINFFVRWEWVISRKAKGTVAVDYGIGIR